MNTEIAIIGGGICGLATALAAQQRGIHATVYESTTQYKPVGAGILLQTNAMSVLDELGVAEAVRTQGAELGEVPFRTPDGRRLAAFDLSFEREQFGHGFVAIHRATLQEILRSALDSAPEMGMECAAVSTPENPTVRFTDGTTHSPDAVIGADGIGSTVRSTVAPNAQPEPAGCVAYRGVTTVDDSTAAEPGFEVWGEGSFVGCSPLGDGRTYWYATTTAPLAPDGSAADRKAALSARFESYPAPIPTLIESTPAKEVILTPLADIPALDSWSTGAVAFAGDAAHPMLPFAGQGAAQALEDAAVIATALDRYDSPETAFAGYERCRKPRAERIVLASRRVGRLATIDSTVGCRLRNLAARLIPTRLTRRLRATQAVPSRLSAN